MNVFKLIAVYFGMVVALWGFSTINTGIRWWWIPFGIISLETAVIVAARRVGSSRSPIFASLAGAGYMVVVFGMHADGYALVSSFLLSLLFGSVLVVLDLPLDRDQRLGILGGFLLVTLAVPPILGGGQPTLLVMFVAAASWLTVAWLGVIGRPSYGAVLTAAPTAAVALALGLIFVLALPRSTPVFAFSMVNSGRLSPDRSPMLNLREDLTSQQAYLVAAGTTTADSAPYLRLFTLDTFDDTGWSASKHDASYEPAPGVRDGVYTTETANVTVQRIASDYAPVPTPVLAGPTPQDALSVGPAGRRYEFGATSAPVDYTVDYAELVPAPDALASLTAAGAPAHFTSLPEDVPATVREHAAEYTAGLDNDYERVLSMQNRLRSDFTYSLDAPVDADFTGDDTASLEAFFSTKSGYCVHFASALTLMARSEGIPARIAVGYAPGVVVGTTADGLVKFETYSTSLHAWTEVWFDSVGWVRFDATPQAGAPTAPETSVSTPEGGQFKAPRRPSPLDQLVPSAESLQAIAGLSVAAVSMVLVIVLSPSLARLLRRPGRWILGMHSVEILWREVIDTAFDLGHDPPLFVNPRIIERYLVDECGAPPGDMVLLLRGLEAERYGPPGLSQDLDLNWNVARRVIKSMRASVRWPNRVASFVWPRSLWARIEQRTALSR